MNYCNIKPFTIENGEGVRVSLFVSGCRNRCKDCFQKETWDFNYGRPFTSTTKSYILELLSHPRIEGLTILGGEPFEPENQSDILNLILDIKKELPTKSIWIYTGCVLETSIKQGRCYIGSVTDKILEHVDVIIDGPFVSELKNLSLPYRGSENQRILKRGLDF